MTIFAKKPVVVEGVEYGRTLLEHTLDVLEAFRALFGDEERPTLLAKQWLRFFRISESDAALFFQNARIAVILHDLGKSNEHFQAAVRGGGRQTLRHEFLAGWLLSRKPFRRALEAVDNVDFQIVRASVMGHHLKLERGIAEKADCEKPSVALFPDGIQEILDLLTKTVRCPSVPEDAIPKLIKVKGEEEQFFEIEQDLESAFEDDDRRTRLLRAVRSALILADAAGSGLAREAGKSVFIPLTDWIADAFDDEKVLTDEKIEEKIVAPRCRQIEAKQIEGKRGKPFVFSDFQLEAAGLPDRALLLASCGSGKTLAAWKWGMGVASRRAIRRFIFLYPTRATATEGFKDYVAWAPESDGALLHGTSKYELQDMFDNTDSRYDKDFLANDRLFAVGFWQKRIFSATVDQFLSFMSHEYRSTCLLPLLAECAVVFDEVHSFDARLFSALLGFLREFDVPALCMTASLPPARIKQLEESGLEVFPKKPESYADLWKNSSALRYTVRRATRDEAAREVAEEWRKGGKILWVVNTVKRCQEAAEELASMLPKARIICYHSRFRLMDRQAAHKELIAAFREDGPMIAVTTQVCEMSLDLSASLLVSEFAPLTALIQRMGRCNRILKIESVGRVLLYPPENVRPYSDDEMKNVADFVNEIDAQFVSQARLQELLEKYSPSTREMEKQLAFIQEDGYALASDKGIRDIEDHSASAILERDIGEYWRLRNSGCPVDGLVLPAPFKSTVQGKGLPPHLRVATGEYSERLGLRC